MYYVAMKKKIYFFYVNIKNASNIIGISRNELIKICNGSVSW